MDVSDPLSPNYGKHWSPEKVSISSKMSTSNKKQLVETFASSEAQSLLKTEYREYEHLGTSKRSVGCEEYSVPADLRRHIDYVTPTVNTAVIIKRSSNRWGGRPEMTPNTNLPPPIIPGKLTKRDSGGYFIGLGNFQLLSCPEHPRLLADIPRSTYAVVEYNSQGYYAPDLFSFLANLVTVTNYANYDPTVYVMSDANMYQGSPNFDDYGEGNLDVQVAQGLVYPAHTMYYQLNDDDVFLDAVDASYCSVGKAGSNCGTIPIADVIGVSWGGEETPGNAYQTRTCNEYMKLGLLGTTMLYASGDNGVGDGCTTFQIDFSASCLSDLPVVSASAPVAIPC
ncbi:uncharacterized protein PAC_19374 [Phialocephala subalpina]|uniref:Peptidase S53 activation domain-containing protein n=1 Tax=Phialocephala subalpina TaxID=576137 RepID=A0A1L7XWR5_9HELO|nr:uncharacterized protein PAC_19374 [Phialocephala subalpina]